MIETGKPNIPSLSFSLAGLALLILVLSIIYGIILRPALEHGNAWSLQHIFLQSAGLVCLLGLYNKFAVKTLAKGIIHKLKQASMTLVLLLLIGVLVGSWIVSGTLPYLIAKGFQWISADGFYLFTFLIASVFSLCTGSSWSTIATIGVVMITIGNPAGANLAALTGAIVGGAYFGDKLSPISDTTNIASVASKIPVEEHIKGMMPTTVPAYILAAVLYYFVGHWFPVSLSGEQSALASQAQSALTSLFNFSPLLLLPPLVLLIVSILRLGAIWSVLLSSICAFAIALLYQSTEFVVIEHVAMSGYQIETLAPTLLDESPLMATALNRGGVLMLWDAVEIVICAFMYIGLISAMQVLPTIINFVSATDFTPRKLMTYTLLSSGLVNSMTSSQYANSFVVAEAFGKKFDDLGIHRRYLSRSLEDSGTMLESMVPWTTTAVFIAGTLNVSVTEYWSWQFFTWFNLIFAFYLAATLSTQSKEC